MITARIWSAGIALHRWHDEGREIFLVHPGGPYWAKKDQHGWSIPKGVVDDTDLNTLADGAEQQRLEVLERTARREFLEETGHAVPAGELVAIPAFRLGSGKALQAYLIEGEVDATSIVSNEFELEWPPRSGRMQRFPEVDRAAWFDFDEARDKLHKGQVRLIDDMAKLLGL